ncbi:RagB/SusD family nutrient uptake outer membrane protein [Mucilaginibacter sp. CSA2-8R]|uniref:RagB/SusD family nutrient uptake outer membrane protein n=1 Tax=Mucilaginibacter sp. CSA2-8R TaxID=3141542 RepID=UPI00315C5D65
MKKLSLNFINKIVLLACLMLTFSCKKILDVPPQDQVDISNNYRNVSDANAAVIGIYGQIMGIADRFIVLNELRGDLMSPTANADQYLREISTHTVSANNPWADPKPFYRIILNCNDALKNFDIMIGQAKMRRDEYNQLYADVSAVRAWLYLQLGMHFGSVPYVTDALETVEALKDESKFPRLSFNDMLDKLIATMANGYLDVYTATTAVTGSSSTSLNTTVDGYPTNLFFINKRALLGDLYLWRGNYTKAAEQYKYLAEQGGRNFDFANNLYYWQYKACYADGNNNDVVIRYDGGRNSDSTSISDVNSTGWRSIFGRTTQDTPASGEWIWSLPFDKNFQPTNPFIDLFSNQGGRYLLTASKLAMRNWNSQVQSNGFPFDQRGRVTVRNINGQPVIMKYLYNYLTEGSLMSINILQKQGRWLLYRAGTLNLHLAEAANRDGKVKVAYALTNVGIRPLYQPSSVPADVTNIQQTDQPYPYNYDARQGETPYYRGQWSRQVGTRTRANLVALPATLYTNNDITGMEDAIINEDALELAYEGQRWGDLLRVALRRNDPNYVAEKVYQKLLSDNNPAASTARTKLLSSNGLYLPFKL